MGFWRQCVEAALARHSALAPVGVEREVGGAAVHMLVMPTETHPTLDAERGALTEPNLTLTLTLTLSLTLSLSLTLTLTPN